METIAKYIKMIFIAILFLSAALSYFLSDGIPDSEPLRFTKANTFPALLFILAWTLYYLDQEQYKGGYFTYIGCFLAFLGFFSLSSEIELFLMEGVLKFYPLTALTLAVLFFYFGHKKHKNLKSDIRTTGSALSHC